VRLPNSRALFVLAIAACGFVAIFNHRVGVPFMALTALAFVAVELYTRFDYRRASQRWLAAASLRPIVLRPPFEGRWRVSSGGPDPRHNHHASRPDQYFGYDFTREGGDSFDRPILAPIAGMVAHVEMRQPDAPVGTPSHNAKRPLGNYISIQTSRGYVILAHLKQGSIAARVGDTVTIGHEIARSGNSGTTRGEHLHVHAQDQPSENPEAAHAAAIAFAANEHADPLLLEFGDALG
jgi:murein DD-endopeptidase MepM/ murein hydrolase activator NlpD